MNCKNCEINCIKRYNLEIYNQEELNEIPALHVPILIEFADRNILNGQKNDEWLIKYLKSENIYKDNEELCYFNLAFRMPELIEESNIIWNTTDQVIRFWIGYFYYSFGNADNENNELINVFKEIKKTKVRKKYKTAEVKIRTDQSKFREELLYIHKKCQICGIRNKNLLVASHVKRYCESNESEIYDPYNGFILCKSHDGLYDSGLITFTDEGNIIISDELDYDDREILNINENIKIDLEEESLKYLKWHRENWFKK